MASRRRVRWHRIADVLLLGVIATPAWANGGLAALPAHALDRPSAIQPDADIALRLAVTLNQTPQSRLLPFVSRAGRLHADAGTLRAMGFSLAASNTTGLLPLDAIPGAQVRYDSATQHVSIDAPLSQLTLDTTRIGQPSDDPGPVAADSSPGVLLNYDVYASDARDGSQLSAGTELRVFGIGTGVLSNTALLRTWQARSPDEDQNSRWQRDSVRLDTRWDFAFPASAVSVTVGDTLTGFLDWSRPVRIGGLQIGRNFALQPYRITTPTPAFLGEVAVPSAVELYVNGLRQYQGQLPTGPFEMTTLPGISGAGTAQVVITDAFGRSRTLDFPFYATQRLLAAGLSDWSLAAGRVRQDYGLRSFAYYPDTVASANLRYGANDRLTLEAHAEGGGGLRNAGIGGAWLLGMAGVLSGSHVRSQLGDRAGGQTTFAYSWQPGPLNLSLDSQRTHGDYRDVASLYGPLPPLRTDRALVGYLSQSAGSFNLSYLRLDQADPDVAPARYAGAFWSRTFERGWSASVSLNQNLDAGADRSLSVGVLVPLGRDRQLSVAAQRQPEGQDLLMDVSRPIPGDGGFGWRVQGRAGDGGGGLAEVGWLREHGRLLLGAGRFGDRRQTYAQADGALVWMGGGLFPSRRVDDAFAVVTTDGFADVPVRLENRTIGRTDARGRLLVTPLRAWQRNQLGLDPMTLPADVRIDDVSLSATPSDRAGTTVGFQLRRVRAALLVLHDSHDAPLPMGATVTGHADVDGVSAIVGYDGEAYVEGLTEDNRLRVRTDAGDCVVDFRMPGAATATIPRIGALRCLPAPEAQ
ncbi:fimbria/pilus outer membrane usher protein [Luteimonas sp. A1P009]|uniref:Fimbria/pilus outer membrane usher protein n=1 Tax=Luteimonas fraxinea TaxID=2901869 RepID=A0ABS8UIB5_9GAMM|nr:fimbria/pilus outer membrane usher protein [Luteimonas fraxinea]MCD9098804.1 fimbria/pilus outer membrane usher protein [Luteimonas fraxinea]